MKTIFSWLRKGIPPPDRRTTNRLLTETTRLAGLDGGKTISFSFVDSATIAETNWDFLRHEGDTDVISFNYETGDGAEEDVAGEVIVCVDKALEEGPKRGLSYQRELVLYIVHGTLHVAGEDDTTPAQKRVMRRREKKVMAALEKEFDFESIFPSPSRGQG